MRHLREMNMRAIEPPNPIVPNHRKYRTMRDKRLFVRRVFDRSYDGQTAWHTSPLLFWGSTGQGNSSAGKVCRARDSSASRTGNRSRCATGLLAAAPRFSDLPK